MRATSDYWVNGFDGRSIFKVNCDGDTGMIHVIENDIAGPQSGILRVEIHRIATPKDNRLLNVLCKEVNLS